MNGHFDIAGLAADFTRRYMAVLKGQLPKTERTYGFEFEFLPDRVLQIEDVADVEALLSRWGKCANGAVFFENGLCIAFEPGGQLEYCSPPLAAGDEKRLDRFISFMEQINAEIRSHLGISYLPRGYVTGRRDAPLCLTSERYVSLHRRLAASGTRGHEMMKATASIHLHVAICSIEELLPLFFRLCSLAREPLFHMSAQRREIWDSTDPTRCGMPPCCSEPLTEPEELIDRLIRFGLHAVALGEEVPFFKTADTSFETFLYHMTTIFTDVRFNLKGTTLELRTLDSMPMDAFRQRWLQFISKTAQVSASC